MSHYDTLRVVPWAEETWPALVTEADMLLNATPLGRQGEMPVDADHLPRQGAVVDLVYVAGDTPLVRAARLRGLRAAGGWTALLAQGAAAFEAWTGRQASLAAMREAMTR